jgi:hypothetical protein
MIVDFYIYRFLFLLRITSLLSEYKLERILNSFNIIFNRDYMDWRFRHNNCFLFALCHQLFCKLDYARNRHNHSRGRRNGRHKCRYFINSLGTRCYCIVYKNRSRHDFRMATNTKSDENCCHTGTETRAINFVV